MSGRRTWALFGVVGLLAAGCPRGGDGGGTGSDRPEATPAAGVQLVIFPRAAAPGGDVPLGFAIVQDRRQLQLAAGVNDVRTDGVPPALRDSSATLRSFTDPDGTRVRSQRFDYDARDALAALDRQIGGDVVVVTDAGEVRGKLVTHDASGLTIDTGAQGDARYRVVPLGETLHAIRLGDHAGGWLVAPSLVWTIEARRAGPHLVEILYETGGVSWWAHHVILLDEDTGTAKVTTWGAVENRSGRSFDGASLRLVEAEGMSGGAPYGGAAYGGVGYGYGTGTAYEPPPIDYYEYGDEYGGMGYGYGAPAQAGKKPDFHVYAVQAPIALPDGGTTQLGLPSVPSAKWRFEDRYEAVSATLIADRPNFNPQHGAFSAVDRATRELVLSRDEGPALPEGVAHVYRIGPGGETEPLLIADARLAHVAAGKEIRLSMGATPDLTARRSRKRMFHDQRGRKNRETIEIRVENRGTREAHLRVIEHMYRAPEWTIRKESTRHDVVSPRTVAFPVTVPAGESATVSYEVEYSW